MDEKNLEKELENLTKSLRNKRSGAGTIKRSGAVDGGKGGGGGGGISYQPVPSMPSPPPQQQPSRLEIGIEEPGLDLPPEVPNPPRPRGFLSRNWLYILIIVLVIACGFYAYLKWREYSRKKEKKTPHKMEVGPPISPSRLGPFFTQPPTSSYHRHQQQQQNSSPPSPPPLSSPSPPPPPPPPSSHHHHPRQPSSPSFPPSHPALASQQHFQKLSSQSPSFRQQKPAVANEWKPPPANLNNNINNNSDEKFFASKKRNNEKIQTSKQSPQKSEENEIVELDPNFEAI